MSPIALAYIWKYFRPKGEIQEVVFIPSEKHESKTLKCTYITVEQVPVTYAGSIISK